MANEGLGLELGLGLVAKHRPYAIIGIGFISCQVRVGLEGRHAHTCMTNAAPYSGSWCVFSAWVCT